MLQDFSELLDSFEVPLKDNDKAVENILQSALDHKNALNYLHTNQQLLSELINYFCESA